MGAGDGVRPAVAWPDGEFGEAVTMVGPVQEEPGKTHLPSFSES